VSRVDLGDHRRAGRGVETAHRIVVEPLDVIGLGARVLGSQRGADRDDVADQPHVQRLLQEGLGDGAERDPGRCLAGAGPLEDRAGVVESVLLHAGEIGVPRARPGQRSVARQPLQDVLVDRVRRHDLLPLGPLGVADAQGNRPTLGQPVPDPAEQLEVVTLEGHPRAAAVTEAATCQRGVQFRGSDGDT
jgi:hypothetical protein